MPFQKGQSGNPRGRQAGTPNKATAELRKFAGKYTTDAIKGLAQIAQTSESDQARVAAWREILDRAVGKAPQAHTDADGEPLAFPGSIAFIVRQLPGAENRS